MLINRLLRGALGRVTRLFEVSVQLASRGPMERIVLLFCSLFGLRCVGMVARGVDGDLGSPSCLLFLTVSFAVRLRFSTRSTSSLGAAGYGVVSGYRLVLHPKMIGFGIGGRLVLAWGRGFCLESYCEGLPVYLQ